MIAKGMPKPSASGALAQNTMWYSLLTVLAVAVIFSVSDEQFWQLPSAYAMSDPAYDSANHGTPTPRSFARGISESLSVTSTFGSPSAPNHYARAMSESISVTSAFPGQAQPTGQAAGSTMRATQYSPGINQRGDERINMTFKSLKRNDLIDKTLTGGTQYLNLEVLAASPSTPDSFSGEMESSGDASDPDDNSNFLHLAASNVYVDQEKSIQNAALLNASISAMLLGGAFGVVVAKHSAFSEGRTRSVLALFLFKRKTVPPKAGGPATYVFLIVLVIFTFSSFAISITPTSGQEYVESLFKSRIELTSAYHLDSDRTVESDIYEESRKLDGIWTEEISDGHYLRLTFEQDLTSINDITIYPRILSGNPEIEVYEKGGTEIIAKFTPLRDDEYNKVLLTSLQRSSDTFDLRVRDGSVEFDHIVDPAIPSLRPTADGTCSFVESSGGTTNCPANLFAEVDDDPDTPTTTDYITNNNLTGGGSSTSGSVFFLLTDMPSDFSSMDTLQIDADIRKTGFVDDTVTWVAQVFQSDETTSLTNQVTLATQATADGLVSISFALIPESFSQA